MSKKNIPVTVQGKFLKDLTEKIKLVSNVLLTAGFNPITLPLYVTQVMLESDWLTSPHVINDNNLSGIKMARGAAGRAFQQKLGVTQGRKAGYGEGDFHSKYPTLKAWAQDYKRILNMGASPLQAVDPKDFVNRLFKNGYFTAAGLPGYTKGFSGTLPGIRKILSTISAPQTPKAPQIGTLIVLLGVFFLVFLN
jgi:hypothetical protein